MSEAAVLPHDLFIDRWARLFLYKYHSIGPKEAEHWANVHMNRRDFKRIKKRITELSSLPSL